MRLRIHRLLSTTLASMLLATAALAQNEGPALDTSSGSYEPPSDSEAEPAIETPGGGSGGTSIIGDNESPIGLYIIPWRASSPTPQLDRPARFVDAAQEPVDEKQFRRFVEYHEALSRHRGAQRSDERTQP